MRRSVGGAVLALLAATVPVVTGAGAVVNPPVSGALSPGDIARLSANPADAVIVVLRDQHREAPGTPAQRPWRAAVLRDDQSAITAELAAVGARRVHPFTFVNAIAATISKAEADRLAADPSVLAVVPDGIVRGPAPATSAAAIVAAGGTVPVSSAAAGTGVCPSDPTQPLLEPEALGLMDVERGPGSTGLAAHDLATGRGVKIAVFTDGLDPNIPDFTRADGRSAVFDYRDFTGEGTGAKTGGAEAFGDVSSLVAQGTHAYDLSGQVNPAVPLPAGCTIHVKGVAPDASVAVMKVFGRTNVAFNSEILQGIDWALTVDKVDVISQSFGGNPVPDPGGDPVAVLDQDAVAAGVTVVVATGDGGTANTIGSPSVAPGAIRVGASTSYRLYAQTGSYGYPLAGNGWLDNMVSAGSSSGVTEYGPATVDVLAPGEAGWADCSADTTVFAGCADGYGGATPQPVVAFAGTSASAPLTAGTAALVIEAYRDTHGGASPPPDLVKRIVMSSAQDLHVPAANQGAGLVDALRAVELARSVRDANGSPWAPWPTLLYSPTSIGLTAAPGQTTTVPVTVTNTGPFPQHVTPALRVLGPASTIAEGDLTLGPAPDAAFPFQTGLSVTDAQVVPFTVPGGTDRVVSRIAWSGDDLGRGGPAVRATLFDPHGRIAATSRPQGPGSGFAEDEIHDPTPGTWKLLLFDPAGYTGPVHYTVTAARFDTIRDPAPPSARLIEPGASATFDLSVTTPAVPGDTTEAVTFDVPGAAGPPAAIIPVALRSLVPVDRVGGGSFSGTLTGGNARAPVYSQELVYQFDVPPGAPVIDADISVGVPGYRVYGFLVDPGMAPVDVQSTVWQDGSENDARAMHLTWANPRPGRWNLDLTLVNGIESLRTSTPITGTIRLASSGVDATGLPDGQRIAPGAPLTATIRVVNTGIAPAEYSVDPRLDHEGLVLLHSASPTSGVLPITGGDSVPQFVVPPFSTGLLMVASSTVPIDFDTSPAFGYPDLLSSRHGTAAIVAYRATDVTPSTWSCAPTEAAPAPARYACAAEAATKPFDPAVSSTTGNIWSKLEGLTSAYSPVILLPGQAADITVTFRPSGNVGKAVAGFLAVETYNFDTMSSDVLATLPYSYRPG